MAVSRGTFGLFILAMMSLAMPGGPAAQAPVFAAEATVVKESETKPATTGRTSGAPAASKPSPPAQAAPSSDKAKPAPDKPSDKKKPDERKDGKPKPDGEKKESGDEKKKPDGEEGKTDKPPETIERPGDSPEPADPEELKVRPDETGKVRFNFTGQKWPDVLQWLADISQMSLDWQELPGDYLNLITQRSYTVAEARDLINRHLLARGYTLLRRDELLTVVKIEKLNPSMVPRVEPDELDRRDPHEFVKVSFALDSLVASAAAEEFKPMLSSHGKLEPLSATNRLEAFDAVANLLELKRLLAQEQSDVGQQDFRQFKLKHTRAEDVRELLAELMGLPSKRSAPAPAMSPQQMKQMQQMQKQQAQMMAQLQQQQKKAGKKPAGPITPGKVSLVVNARENVILAYAPPDKMAMIEQAIAAVDVPSDRSHSYLRNKERVQVYRLEKLTPGSLIKTLEELGDLDFDTRLEADEQNNAMIADASLADHLTIRALVEKLDGGGRRAEVIQLTKLRAVTVAETVNFMMGGGKKKDDDKENESRSRRSYSPFFGFGGYGRYSRRSSRPEEHTDQFRIDADAKNNRLLLWCNDFELAKVLQIRDHLREMPENQGKANAPKVYHLVTLDPEPFVKALEDLETLDFYTRLEVDKENSAIIAFASEEDHAKIADLISTLDGSSREFHVISLRRLEADYVAGTISFMMAGKEEQQSSGYSRTYVYSYGDYSSRGDKKKKPDEFRVDADVEYNRLLLWANEVEIEEVRKLLVKLGELPPEDGDPNTIRVLDVLPGPEQQQLLERIRKVWPSLSPNPLVAPPPEESKPSEQPPGETETEEEEEEATEEPVENESPSTTAPDNPASPSTSDSGASNVAQVGAKRSVFQLALLQQEEPPPKTFSNGPREEAPSEVPAAGPKPPAAKAASESDNTPPAPVSITQAPDGRLVITSQDTKALDQLEDLMRRLAPPRKDYAVFHLDYADAYYVKWNLEDFFEEEDDDDRSSSWDSWWFGYYPSRRSSDSSSRRLSKRRPLKFIYDDDTNSILVQGADPGQLKTIQELIDLYDKPQMADSESARRTKVFSIRYSKAAVVAETVKDVYRDLLSTRDKALEKQQQQGNGQRRGSRFYGWSMNSTGADGALEKKPKFKGLLSIGIDEFSNTLVVSAPEVLLRDIGSLIEDLDEKAKPVENVRVLKLGPNVTADHVREVLSGVLGDGKGARKSSGRPARPKPKPVGPKPANGSGTPSP